MSATQQQKDPVLVVLQLIPMLWVTDRRMDAAEAEVEAEEHSEATTDSPTGR